jgi:hypothetical protein
VGKQQLPRARVLQYQTSWWLEVDTRGRGRHYLQLIVLSRAAVATERILTANLSVQIAAVAKLSSHRKIGALNVNH